MERLNRSNVLDLLVAISDRHPDLGDVSLSDGYSGRGMYGKRCVGFVVECAPVAFAMVFGMVAGEFIDDEMILEEMATAARWDSLGRDTIVYFPGFELEDDSEEL